MKLYYQSVHVNIFPEDDVESLKRAQGVTEHLHEREDEKQEFSIFISRVPPYYQANGVRKKSRSWIFVAAALVRG